MKKSPDRYLVAIDKKGDFNLVDIAQKDKLPPEAIVGKLTNLYDKLVRTAKTTVPAEQSFIKQQKDSVMKKQPNINKNSTMVKENEKNLAQRKTFFKQ